MKQQRLVLSALFVDREPAAAAPAQAQFGKIIELGEQGQGREGQVRRHQHHRTRTSGKIGEQVSLKLRDAFRRLPGRGGDEVRLASSARRSRRPARGRT